MDFALDELQTDLAALAERILRRGTSVARLKELEAGGTRLDIALWQELRAAGLAAVALPDALGGAGLGFFEHCLVLEQLGKTVAPVPLTAHGAGLMALAHAGNSLRAQGNTLSGTVGAVSYAAGASALLLPARIESGDWRLFLVKANASGLSLEAQANTALEPASRLQLSHVVAMAVGDAATPDWLHQRLVVSSAAVQVGVLEETLAMSTRYVSEREQFGVKIGSFQSVSHRMADAWIDLMNLRLLTRSTASVLDREPLATLDALSTQFWCAEAGHRVMASCQHVHGGMGHDRD